MARDYTTLIASEYQASPKFMSMISQIGAIFGANYDVMANMYAYHDLDLAFGKQLDTIGLWVGCPRRVDVPITGVYFAFDTAGLGFDQGVWQGPHDPDTGVVLLDDDTYRQVLRGVIAANTWDGTLKQLQKVMQVVFLGTGSTCYVIDNRNMTMSVVVTGAKVPAVIQAEMQTGRLHIKPACVAISSYTFP